MASYLGLSCQFSRKSVLFRNSFKINQLLYIPTYSLQKVCTLRRQQRKKNTILIIISVFLVSLFNKNLPVSTTESTETFSCVWRDGFSRFLPRKESRLWKIGIGKVFPYRVNPRTPFLAEKAAPHVSVFDTSVRPLQSPPYLRRKI